MPVKVITAPQVEPISLTRAKLQLRIDPDDTTDDSYIQELVTAARSRAEMLTNRGFVTQTVRETRDDFPRTIAGFPRLDRFASSASQRWELLRSPLQEIEDVRYLDINGVEQVLGGSAYYVVDGGDEEPAALYPASGTCWPMTMCERPAAAWINYSVGYSDDDSKVPATAKSLIALMVAHWYQNREPVQDVAGAEVPMTVSDLIDLNKVRYQP